MKETLLTVLENTRLADGIYRLRLAGDTSAITAPGQFVNLKLSGFFLRRPISVCDWENGEVTLIYKVLGHGTEAMAGCGAILYQVADQPLLEQDTVRRELEYFRTHPDHIVGLAHNGVRGNPCIFPRKFFPELMALEGDVGGNVVIRAHPDALLLYETSAAELRDVDTVEALAAIQEDRQI